MNFNQRRYGLTLLLISLLSVCNGQVVVDSIRFIETVDKRYVSYIPKVRGISGENSKAIAAINASILDEFMLESFKQSEIEEFRWYDVVFRAEVKSDIVAIAFAGEYYGAYPSYVERELFYDLKTGELIENKGLPFQALFTLSGYLDFMNHHWLTGAKREFQDAVECAKYEPSCSYYDITTYSVQNNKLSISLTEDCYARVARACSPMFGLTLPLDSLNRYLSALGRKVLFEDAHTQKIGVEKLLYNQAVASDIPNNWFLFGKVAGKYPFSMALSINDASGEIRGYYYYDRKLQKLVLTGQKIGDSRFKISESVSGKNTGHFVLNLSDKYVRDAYSIYSPGGQSSYLTGTWSDPQHTKTYTVEFTEVKKNVE